MISPNIIKLSIVVLMCMAIIFGSCTVQSQDNVEATLPSVQVSVSRMQTGTQVSSISQTPSPNIATISSSSIQKTTIPTGAFTPTLTQTMTPLPTLSPEAAEQYVEDLFETNRGCLFPCWWGFIPGNTTWVNAKHFLAQFAEFNNLVDQTKPEFAMDVLVPVPKELSHIPLEQIYQVEEGVINTIEAQVVYSGSYTLSTFLETYGQPGEVWLSTYSTEYPAGVLPFLAALFYPDRGILAIYGPLQADIVGEVVRACNWDNPPSMFGLWSPDQGMSFIDAARHFRLNPDEPGFLLLPLEEATNIDTQTFYEIFMASGNSECLETPIDIWPSQQ